MADIALHAVWANEQQARASFLQRVAPWCIEQWRAGHRLEIDVRLHEDAKTDRQHWLSHVARAAQADWHAEVYKEQLRSLVPDPDASRANAVLFRQTAPGRLERVATNA